MESYIYKYYKWFNLIYWDVKLYYEYIPWKWKKYYLFFIINNDVIKTFSTKLFLIIFIVTQIQSNLGYYLLDPEQKQIIKMFNWIQIRTLTYVFLIYI